jgi:cbb3-type cytochrome oxidase subunit 3
MTAPNSTSDPTIANILAGVEEKNAPDDCKACGDRRTGKLADCLEGKRGGGKGHNPWLIALVIVLILVIAYFAYARYRKHQSIKQAAQSALHSVESALHIHSSS